MPKGIVLLLGRGTSSRFVFNGLKNHFLIKKVIIESPLPRFSLVRKRVRKLGLARVFGQILFRVLVVPYLKWSARVRMAEICRGYELDSSPIPDEVILAVGSVNDQDCAAALRQLAPALVVVNGTRIVAPSTLRALPGPFINTHVGITPRYRGVHGGYWALAQADETNFGVTVHRVDEGIDTGSVMCQARMVPTDRDNFCTYPLLQYGYGLPLLRDAIRSVLAGTPCETQGLGPSKLWYHPTLWQYFYYRLTRGVK